MDVHGLFDQVGPNRGGRDRVTTYGARELGYDADGPLGDRVEVVVVCGGLMVEATDRDVRNDSKSLDSSEASWSELITVTLGLGSGRPWSSQPASTMALYRLTMRAAAVVSSLFSLVLRNSTKMKRENSSTAKIA